MKKTLRFVSPLLVVIAASSIPLTGCKRITTDVMEGAADHVTELAFEQASDGGMDVRVWHLTDDFPKAAPIDPKANLLTSASIEIGHGEKGWVAGFWTDESAEQVIAFYDSRMRRTSIGDAGKQLADLENQMSAQSLQLEASDTQLSTTTRDQKQVTTPFDFGSQGMLVLKTYDTKNTIPSSAPKKVMFTITVVNSGRPKA